MKITEVTTRADEKEFLQIHNRINGQFPGWVRPLDQDVLNPFTPGKNKLLTTGQVVRYLAFDDNAKPLGRLAAFVNPKYRNKGDRVPVGGIGFFDSIDDKTVAHGLFDKAKAFLQSHGMQAMDGPINFGERDRWWGLLTEGFHTPLYGMNYNPPYYQQLFESYGFQPFYNQLCWSLPLAGKTKQLAPRFYEAHQEYARNPAFEARYIRRGEWDKLIHDFCHVYNKAWAKHEGNKEISEAEAAKLFKAMKPVFDPYLVWFVYKSGEPIAMWISIPDLNQLIGNLKGQLNTLGKIKFLVNKLSGKCTRFVGIIYGIVPEFQGSGVDYFMIVEGEKTIKAKTRYRETELQWQGDFNPKMLNISRNLGAVQSRNLITYRYLFDRSAPFERHPMLG